MLARWLAKGKTGRSLQRTRRRAIGPVAI